MIVNFALQCPQNEIYNNNNKIKYKYKLNAIINFAINSNNNNNFSIDELSGKIW